ncbi:GNAT family N-acetyltransferase [Sorangium sp. So ce1036]|uniref:GNAT family N-acetyltransferase n=1 Tax=Sorangium sp. So ce1036 TaxID=3133328 RepID=UPI003F0E58C8
MEKVYSAARIRPEEHRDVLAELWRVNLAGGDVPQELVERRMRWFQEQNPAGPARTWMGYHGPEREVIGSGSFIPRDVHVSGRMLKAGVLGDFAVTKAHRIAGAAMSIQREIAKGCRDAGVDFLYGFPNKASFPIFQRAGYRKISDSTTWVRPLTAAYKIHELAALSAGEQQDIVSAVTQRVAERAASAVPHARWRALWESADPGAPPAPLARALSTAAERAVQRATVRPDSALVRAAGRALDASMALRDTAALLAKRVKGGRVRTEITESADHRFDALWSRAKPSPIAGERSAAFLNWRYARLGAVHYRFFCMLDRHDGRLLGYAVYTVRNNKVEVVDLFCEDHGPTADLLLLELCQAMRREGHASVGILLVSPPSFGARLRALGFFARPHPPGVGSRWLVVHVDPSSPDELRRALLDPNSWFMTDGELDV